MAAMRAREIYDKYVKPLSKTERLKLLTILTEDIVRQSEEVAAHANTIMHLHGLGKEIWQGIDAQEYVDELRREWEHD
jgi:hypothetical protein